MLDQNTDRMWYVIGAVLIGAAIIFGMNTLMPNAFASVGAMFDDFIGSVNMVVDGDTEGIYSDGEIKDLIKEGYIPIATADELNNVRNSTPETYGKGTDWEKEYTGGLDKKYVQVTNIDLSGYWTPIGIFTGIYDGGNYIITGLEVKGGSHQGLFGRTDGATISNVALEDINVTGSGYHVGGLVGHAISSTIENSYATGLAKGTENDVGGLVGRADSSTISNSYSIGSVTGAGHNVGGLVGYAYNNITISNSYAKSEVTGAYRQGGLVGGANSSNIENSYSTGSVEGAGENDVGGLVGWAGGSKINNSYTTGSVTGSRWVGGLLGSASESTTISNSYATGTVTGSGPNVGGLVGGDSENTNISNSYWDKETTGQSTSAGGTGKTTKEMKKKDTYSGWDFVNVWKIDDGSYPKLR